MTGPLQPLSGEQDLNRLLAQMSPALDPVRYAYCRMREGLQTDRLTARGIFHENEGTTLILGFDEAVRAGLQPDFICRRIELTIHSDLNAVGFLARIARELTAAGIPANAVAATWHDHLFVPESLADRAMAVLRALEVRSATPETPVMYAVTVWVDQAIADEWLEWIQRVHIPEVLATGCFQRCTIQREPVAHSRIGHLLEYLAHSAEALQRYQQDHAPALQQVHTSRYAGRFEASRTIRTVTAEVIAPLA